MSAYKDKFTHALDVIIDTFREDTKKIEEFNDLLDDIWTLTGSLWEQNETTKELHLMLTEFKNRGRGRRIATMSTLQEPPE